MQTGNSKIQAILFDFGGTLFDYVCLRPAVHDALVRLCVSARLTANDDELAAAYVAALRRNFARYLPQPFYLMRDLFRDAAVDTLEWLSALARVPGAGTTASSSDLLGDVEGTSWQAGIGASGVRCDPFLEVTERDFRLDDGVADTLTALRRRGLCVGLVTNMDGDQLAHLVRVSGLDPQLDFVLGSEEVRSCKPDGRILHEAVRRAGSTPSSTVLVGDSPTQDIAGAKRAGLRSVLVTRGADQRPPTGGAAADFVIRHVPELLDLLDEPTLAIEGA